MNPVSRIGTRDMSRRRRVSAALVAATVGLIAFPVGSASALTRKNSTGTVTCTATANNPTLVSGVVYSSVTYSCTASTKLYIRVGIAEVDGTSTSPTYTYPGATSGMALPLSVTTVTATSTATTLKTSTAFSTNTKCWNSETGNEEFTTALMISYDGKTYYGQAGTSTSIPEYSTAWPTVDAFAC